MRLGTNPQRRERQVVGRTSDGIPVRLRWDRRHNEVGDDELLSAAISQVQMGNRRKMTQVIEFDRSVGRDPFVSIEPGAILTRKVPRGTREPVFCVLGIEAQHTPFVTVVLERDDRSLYLVAAYFGQRRNNVKRSRIVRGFALCADAVDGREVGRRFRYDPNAPYLRAS